MKAKHFKKLRAVCKYYKVETTSSLFGRFDWKWSYTILARTPKEACERAKRRGIGRELSVRDHETTENWASWKVREKSKADHWKNYHYF